MRLSYNLSQDLLRPYTDYRAEPKSGSESILDPLASVSPGELPCPCLPGEALPPVPGASTGEPRKQVSDPRRAKISKPRRVPPHPELISLESIASTYQGKSGHTQTTQPISGQIGHLVPTLSILGNQEAPRPNISDISLMSVLSDLLVYVRFIMIYNDFVRFAILCRIYDDIVGCPFCAWILMLEEKTSV